ncbi:MAG TPA: hypothetical protein V6D28_21825 [Leptolyngbyaceae cyanobacterium]
MRNLVSLAWGNEISIEIAKETRFLELLNWCSSDGKIIFIGHRGCGKSTLLAEFGRPR